MKYIALDIDGWLGGTCARFLTKSEKGIWSDIIVLGGKGKGRFGFVELDKEMGYTRQQLLALCQCFTDEDINTFDSCLHKCLNGTTDGDCVDAPRLKLHPNNVYEIINWDKYQHSDYLKGLTEAEAKALKRSNVKPDAPTDKSKEKTVWDGEHGTAMRKAMAFKGAQQFPDAAKAGIEVAETIKKHKKASHEGTIICGSTKEGEF